MRLDLNDKKFLVIDDFPQMRASLKKMIQSFGAADVDDSPNGEDALNKIRKKKYDVILCDYHLGEGKDGQQILEEAKHHHLFKYSTIFMMITAETTSDMVMGAVEYHPDDYLAKPFTREVLGRRLEKLIRRKRDFDDIEAAVYKHQYDLALARCDAHIATGPRNLLEFLKFKSGLCLRLGRCEEASAVCEQVLGMRDIPWAMLDMAKVQYDRGHILRARDMLNDLVESNNAYVAAYDWLAKCQESLGDPHGAQASLALAVELSPRSILRQRALGTLAYKNGDLACAEQAFSRAVRLGPCSIYRDPADQANLTKVLLDRGAGSRALKVANELIKSGKGDADAAMLGHAMQGIIYLSMARDDDARHCVAAGIALYDKSGAKAPAETSLEVASACLAVNQWEQGERIIKDVIRNHHDDAHVLELAAGIFTKRGRAEQGHAVIASARDEIITLRSEGTSLVEQDKLAEAVDFFDQAADRLPDNKLINLNASQVMIMYMERHGRNDKLLYRARRYLDRLQRLDPGNTENQSLLYRYKSLTAAC